MPPACTVRQHPVGLALGGSAIGNVVHQPFAIPFCQIAEDGFPQHWQDMKPQPGFVTALGICAFGLPLLVSNRPLVIASLYSATKADTVMVAMWAAALASAGSRPWAASRNRCVASSGPLPATTAIASGQS